MDDIEKAKQAILNWQLGATSAAHESSGLGPATISTGRNDHGGVSYGTYQFSSEMGTLKEYLSQSHYKDDFVGLVPGTPSFDAKWRQLAAGDPGFGQDQHDFVRRTHYDPQVLRLKDIGIDLSDRGRAVQDALWSTAVQYRTLTQRIFEQGMKEKFGVNYKLADISDGSIVEAVQDYKIKHNDELFKHSPLWWSSLLKRAQEEKADLIELAAQEELLAKNAINIPLDISKGNIAHEVVPRHIGQQSRATVQQLQDTLSTLGYADTQERVLMVDGDYGKRTREAVKAFQRDHGLGEDGIAGPNTWAALRTATHLPSIGASLAPVTLPIPKQSRQLSPEPIVTPLIHPADSASRQLAMLQARMLEMQRQMEILNRQREPEREQKRNDWHTVPNEPAREEHTPALPTAKRLSYSDPRHPQHDLYIDVKERLEADGHHLPEDRLTQVVGEMHMRGFQPGWEGYAKVHNDAVYVSDFSPWANRVRVDLKEPAPSMQEMLRQVDDHQQPLTQQQTLCEQQTQSHRHSLSL